METDPTNWDSVCHARVVMSLKNNLSEPASPVEMSELMQMTKKVITYVDDSKIPLIKDTGIVAIKNLLRNTKKVSEQIQTLKTSFQGISNDLKKIDIPLKEVTKDLDELKVSLEKAT